MLNPWSNQGYLWRAWGGWLKIKWFQMLQDVNARKTSSITCHKFTPVGKLLEGKNQKGRTRKMCWPFCANYGSEAAQGGGGRAIALAWNLQCSHRALCTTWAFICLWTIMGLVMEIVLLRWHSSCIQNLCNSRNSWRTMNTQARPTPYRCYEFNCKFVRRGAESRCAQPCFL